MSFWSIFYAQSPSALFGAYADDNPGFPSVQRLFLLSAFKLI